MGLQTRRASFLVAFVALLAGCVTPPEEKPVDPTPPTYDYGTHFTVRGTELQMPEFIAKRDELLVLTIQEIDDYGVWRDLPGWIVKVLPPGEKSHVDISTKTIHAAWRTPEHEPNWEMLPDLQSLIQLARDAELR